MHLEKQIPKHRFAVDFVAYEEAGKPILFGWATTMSVSPEAVEHLAACLRSSRSKIPFALLADLDQIRLYSRRDEETAEQSWTSPTARILECYDPEFDQKPIFGDYLRGLIQAWLRDLAYHWKSATPPAQEEMASIGLLGRLKGGTTRSEVWLAGHPLP